MISFFLLLIICMCVSTEIAPKNRNSKVARPDSIKPAPAPETSEGHKNACAYALMVGNSQHITCTPIFARASGSGLTLHIRDVF